jgi:hypothetical protein
VSFLERFEIRGGYVAPKISAQILDGLLLKLVTRVEIPLRGLQRGMARDVLHGSKISPIKDEPGECRVPEIVNRIFATPDFLTARPHSRRIRDTRVFLSN